MRRAFRSSCRRENDGARTTDFDDYDPRAHPHPHNSPAVVSMLRKCALVALPSILMLAAVIWLLSTATVPHSSALPMRDSHHGLRVGATEDVPGSGREADDTARRALSQARSAEPKVWRVPRIVGRARVPTLPSTSSGPISGKNSTGRTRRGASVLAGFRESSFESSALVKALPESLDSVSIEGLPALNAKLAQLHPMEIIRSRPSTGLRVERLGVGVGGTDGRGGTGWRKRRGEARSL